MASIPFHLACNLFFLQKTTIQNQIVLHLYNLASIDMIAQHRVLQLYPLEVVLFPVVHVALALLVIYLCYIVATIWIEEIIMSLLCL